MAESLPLPALLSGTLVAFTIELDNAFEHGFVHRTALQKARGEKLRGPWLTSVAMWANCLRWIADEGTTVAEVRRLARTHTNLDGVRRWGYVTVDGRGRDGGGAQRSGPDAVLRLTGAGRRSCERWEPLPAEIEQRWRERFGTAPVDRLRAALHDGFVAHFHRALPDCLPILGYRLFCRRAEDEPEPRTTGDVVTDGELPLWSLLSRVLLGFALAYERDTRLSLAVMADVLRVLGSDGVRAADLPQRSGVSKEAIAMAMTLLQKGHLVEVRSEARRRIVTLTDRGANARSLGMQRIAGVETAWRTRFGAAAVDELRAAAEPIAGDLTRDGSPLFAGLDPFPDGWRADAPEPQTLPWFPMVLHRGGWPDGS
jgi:predicted transcriptional regulator